jgi:uncharacterized protein (TIGR03118 family)
MIATLRSAAAAAKGFFLLTLALAIAACGGGGMAGYTPPPPLPAPSALTYTSPVTTNVSVAMTALNPTVTGTVSSYAVAPALPAGISISGTTGVISGTPTTVTAVATYTITATNASGNTTFPLSLKVDPAPPSKYTLSKLVTNGAVAATFTDPHLKNPWGLAFSPTSPMWVANNVDHTSTLYDGTGLVQALVVSIPAGVNGLGTATGMVASTSSVDFMVTAGVLTAPARFIFATESGTISAWAPTVDATHALVMYDDAAGLADYKGLAIANNGTANFLYAADFKNKRIVVFNNAFTKVTAPGGFTDPTLPAGYSPFNIQAVQIAGATVLVVTYAKQGVVPTDEAAGAGFGLVNTFDANGTLLKHLVPVGGALNAPWGVALAPATFGTLSGALLIGNFGDGKINGYDTGTGAFIGTVSDATGAAIVADGLWGLSFGNGQRNQPTNVLYLTAGVVGETGGLYARIDLGATAPDIVAPTGVAITAPAAAATVSGQVAVSANATDNVGVAKVQFTVRVGATTTDLGTVTAAPFTVNWNTGAVANGAATLTAIATDAFGNSTTSATVAVTVNNVPDTVPPVVALTAPAAGNVNGNVTVSATATDNVGVAQVRFFAGATEIATDTSAPYSVVWNTTGLTGAFNLRADATDGAGNVTSSALVAVTVVATAPTLATLQSTIFGPICSTCHTGGGASLPSSMNLSSQAATAAALIGVNSQEAPALKRVMAGDANNSYVVQKVEGTAAVGGRMPLGGAPLSQANIDGIRAWIQAGAAP